MIDFELRTPSDVHLDLVHICHRSTCSHVETGCKEQCTILVDLPPVSILNSISFIATLSFDPCFYLFQADLEEVTSLYLDAKTSARLLQEQQEGYIS